MTTVTLMSMTSSMMRTKIEEKKIPMRKCIITNERFPKKELIRVVRTPENEVVVDLTGKMNGRGAYLKKIKMCLP